MLDGKIVILLFSCVFIIFFLYKIFSFYKENKYLILGYFFLLLVVVNMTLPLLQTKELIVERKQYYLTAEQQAMFDWIVPLAKSLQRDSGILPSITIAQKIGEQGWNWQDDGIETQCHNYFGMKAGSYWTGPVYTSLTQEEYSGNYVTITDSFRCYSSDAEGFQGRGEFLWMDRYREFIDFCVKLDYRNAVYALKKAGYATSSSYVNTLLSFIEDYNLTQYDNDPKYQWDGTPPGDSSYDGSGGTGSKLKKPKVEDLDLTTSYTGNYEKGYLYSRFAKTLLAPHLKSEKRLAKQEDFIIKDIFKEAINFEWANMGKGDNDTTGSGCGTSAPVLEEDFVITSSFGPRTVMGQYQDAHGAIDIAASGCEGREIHNVATGTVLSTAGGCTVDDYECGGGYGNHAYIGYDTNSDGTDDYVVIYAHMKDTPLVSKDDKVSSGQVIGYIGTTGYSTGPHLHFEIQKDGARIDPEPIYEDLRAKRDSVFGSATACTTDEKKEDNDKNNKKNSKESET